MTRTNYNNYDPKPKKITITGEDLRGENIFDEMWLSGDDKERDLSNLIEQNRLKG